MAEGVNPADLSPDDRLLLTLAQVAFPLVTRPFAALGESIRWSEEAVIARLVALKEAALIRRIGPIFEPAALGLTSELIAAQVVAGRLDAVGASVAAWSEVTHCYVRSHRVNLWFAGVAADATWFEQAAEEVRGWQGVLGVWRLPTLRRFKIAVHFDLTDGGLARADLPTADLDGPGVGVAPDAAPSLPEPGLLAALDADLPLSPRPFLLLAERCGWPEADLLEVIRDWSASGRIRRYGASVNHRRLGFVANAMTVWSVPDDRIEEVGGALALAPEVSHCYQRPRFPEFPFNLYAMIHGRCREECLAAAARLSQSCGLDEPLALFSSKEFKKSAPAYASLLASPPHRP